MRPTALLLLLALAGCSHLQLGGPLGTPSSEPPGTPLGLRWERDADAAFGPSAARVTDRYVVVGTRAGRVVVLDRETGAVEGAGEFGASVEGQLAASENGAVLYVSTAERSGGVEAYDVRAGRRVWRWPGGAVQGGVVRAGGTVVVAALDGRVLGLDAGRGTERWERPPSEAAQVHAAPVAVGADVLVADDRGRVVRLDAQSGAGRWTADVGGPVYATPTVVGDGVYVSTTRGHVARLDAATGATVWTVTTGAPLRATSAAVHEATAVFGFSDGTVRALDTASGAERWRFQADGNVAAAPAWVGERVAVGTMGRRLVVLDGATGREEWSTELRGRVKSALAVGGGLLVVLVEPRHVVAFHTAP